MLLASRHFIPGNSKIGSAVPVDKEKPDKYDVLNSKIYEKVIKNQLVSYFDKYFSSFISAYRKGYSTQQVLMLGSFVMCRFLC